MDANDLLMGGGVKSASFPDQQYGATVTGKIVRPPTVRQQTDFDDGKPKFFDNGDPMMQIVVHLQTDQRDPADSLDDGVRALYIRTQMQAAVRDAVRATGAKGLEVGGILTVTYVADEPNKRGRGKPKKMYSATYQPPTMQEANDWLMGSNGASSVPEPAPSPTLAAPTAVEPAPDGVPQEKWDRMSDQQRKVVLAALAGVK